MPDFYAYLLHLLSGLLMVGGFVAIYLRVTPYCELTLIRQGLVAPVLSLGGATLGFSLTIASSILHNDSYPFFVLWSVAALFVQLLTYVLLARVLVRLPEALAANNVAAGAFCGLIALVVGILNAACLS